jgi:hypothetical protein
MATDRPTSPETDAATGAGMGQRRRWLVFGGNVAVAVILATLLMVVAIWFSGRLIGGKARSDWTAGGRFSLSPRSKAMLKELPCPVTMTNLYAWSPDVPGTFEQYERVQDLLTEYDVAGGDRVTVEAVNPLSSPTALEPLVTRLRERDKPKALLEEYQALHKDVAALLDARSKELADAADAWTGGPGDAVDALHMISQRWMQMKMVGTITDDGIRQMTADALPAYATAVTRGKEYLRQVSENFAAVPGFLAQVEELAKDASPPEAVKKILAAKDAYQPMRDRIAAFQEKAADVGEAELDALRRQIAQGMAILVETPERVKVVAFDEVWVRNPKADQPDAQERLFAGEQAVSSALLGICQTKKPALLFVTFGAPVTFGMPGMGGGGQYAELAERLRKSNFIIQDWDLMRDQEMPIPDDASKVILVFTPPTPPNPQRPMPPASPEQYGAAIAAVREGTPAILMGEPSSMFQQPVPYAGLFDLFGVDGKWNAVAVHKVVVDQRGRQQAVPQIDLTSYPASPITAPMGALPALVLTASPLEARTPLPDGVTLTAIMELPGGPDYWADTVVFEAMQGQATFDATADLAGPLPLAFAATRKVGDGEQKAVMFGDGDFAQDRVAFYADMYGRPMFPGNAEIFVNSCLWVAGTEHLITVSPEALEARRIGDLGGAAIPLQIILIAGLPAAVLAAGLLVYLLRRG